MTKTQIEITSAWQQGSWQDYLEAIKQLPIEAGKSYYHQDKWLIEMTPIGYEHARNHGVIMLAVNLYAIAKEINFNSIDNCSYRLTGKSEFQPDVSYYLGDNAEVIPHDTSIIDLDIYPPPDLVVEVGKTSLADDLGQKRLIYEEVGVGEYWVVDVDMSQVIAFMVADGGSKKINHSLVLPGLNISLLNQTLQKAKTTNQRIAAAWLMQQFNR